MPARSRSLAPRRLPARPDILLKHFIYGTYTRDELAQVVAEAGTLSSPTPLTALVPQLVSKILVSNACSLSLLVTLCDPKQLTRGLYLCAVTEEDQSTAVLVSLTSSDALKVHMTMALTASVKIDLHGDGILSLSDITRPVYCQVRSLMTLWTTVQALRSLRGSEGRPRYERLWQESPTNAFSKVLENRGVVSTDPRPQQQVSPFRPRLTSSSVDVDFSGVGYDLEFGASSLDEPSVSAEDELFSLSTLESPPGPRTKPNAAQVKDCIAAFIDSLPDPDDVTVSDILAQLRAAFGPAIVGKHGYSKAFIDSLVCRVYGEREPPSLILPGLWLGSEFNAANLAEMRRINVSHVLNVAVEIDRFFPDDFVYMKIHVVDDEMAGSLLPFFERACEFIDMALAKGTGVLVHCQKGVSRSATCVVAYVMRRNRLGLADALAFVKQRRKIIKPNRGFLKELERWQEVLESQA